MATEQGNGACLPRCHDHKWLGSYLAAAELDSFDCESESWHIEGSSAELNRASHGFYRYFGKFPPPVAGRFIREAHDPTLGPVVDPMVGSGTTLVEAMLLKRRAVGLDVNPLSCLISKVKTTHVPQSPVASALDAYQRFCESPIPDGISDYIPNDRYLDHWFYPETQRSIALARLFSETRLADGDVKDLFRVALASVIRRVSRASNGMGRMFLDPALAPADVREHLIKKAVQMAKVTDELRYLSPDVQVILHDAKQPFLDAGMTNLVICHPPYFNLYRYTSIYKYEMLWLGYDYTGTRRREVREGFKVGKRDLVQAYVEDLALVVTNAARLLVPGGVFVLMMGDTILRGERINTTSLALRHILAGDAKFTLARLIVRHPKYTEASYAATQRRTGEDVGVKLSDHLVVMEKVADGR